MKNFSKNNNFTRNKNDNFKREKKDNFNDNNDSLQIEGRNPVLEALKNDRTIDKILVKKGGIEGTLKVIVAMAREKGIVVQETDSKKLSFMSQSDNHQGIIALCPAYEYCELQDILDNAKNKNEKPFIIILDEITDPHNFGAIIRTAECAGAHGIIIPKRRSASLTSIVSKTSAGALEYMPICKVTNIAKTIDALKENGVWIACADMDGDNLYDCDLSGSIGLVIGSEGNGVGRLIKDKCDFTVSIPMKGNIDSLNASVAASVLMYEVVRRRMD